MEGGVGGRACTGACVNSKGVLCNIVPSCTSVNTSVPLCVDVQIFKYLA